ncbi:MAG: beta-propeller domain-containing protein [Marmoricola sp.]
MDTPVKAAIGGMVTAGVLATTAAVVITDPTAPPASAAGLERFQSCESLRQWYVSHTIDDVGPWGWGGRAMPMYAEDTALARDSLSSTAGKAATGSTDSSVTNGDTGTNTQEAGVDEPDVAKTDGRIVVQLRDGQRLVVTDVTGSTPRELADWRLPAGIYADELLLVGDHALLSGSQLMGREGYFPGSSSTEIVDVDLSDPASPRLEERDSWAGRSLSLRQYGETVRLVTSIGLPPLRFFQPRPGRLGEQEATRKNQALVRSAPIEEWIPGLACDDVYRPARWSGPETVAVATFRPGEADDATKVAVTGAGSEVYSSTDRLYVTSTDWPRGPIILDGPDTIAKSDVFPRGFASRTHVHAFALGGVDTRYVASGTVDGTIRNRWSLDEQDGHLRVAVSWPDRSGEGSDNGVVVLDEVGGRLEQVGELRGLGVDEDIQSVRWFGDLAVVVTFRQMDPLYTIDLSDPTRPQRLGALKIPGFSSYLHPIGGDRLLGIGTDATLKGESLGAQAAVFDLRDLTRTRQVDKLGFGRDSWFEASEDPRAFTWLPGGQAAITNLQTGTGSTPVLLRVSPDGSLTSEDLPSVGEWGTRALPLPDGRVALAGDRVRIVDAG